jgi:hypothetical protein
VAIIAMKTMKRSMRGAVPGFAEGAVAISMSALPAKATEIADIASNGGIQFGFMILA